MRSAKKTTTRRALIALAASACFALLLAAPALAAPKWRIAALSNPSAAPGSKLTYLVDFANVGDKSAPEAAGGNSSNCVAGAPAPADPSKCYRLVATFPGGLTPLSTSPLKGANCTTAGQVVTCAVPGSAANQLVSAQLGAAASASSRTVRYTVEVSPSAPASLTSSFQLSGAGAGAASVLDSTTIDPTPPQFGIGEFDGQLRAAESGEPFSQAGGHPYDLTTAIELNSEEHPSELFGSLWPVEPTKDIVVDLPVGLVGNPTNADRCTLAELGNSDFIQTKPLCPVGSQVGAAYIRVNAFGAINGRGPVPIYSMAPPAGAPARFGFNFLGTIVVLDAKLRSDSDYGISIRVSNISEGLDVQSSELTFWGVPSEAAHTADRQCPGEKPIFEGGATCSSSAAEEPFFRLPTTCTAPGEGLEWTATADSWDDPGAFDADGNPDLADPAWEQATYTSHKPPAYPAAPGDWGPEQGPEGCSNVPVKGKLKAQPTSIDTETSSGLNVHVEVPNPGFDNKTGVASSDIEAVKVALPKGVTVNPSQAEGLGACAPAQYASTRLEFHPDGTTGCPSDSKIGTVSVKTPLLEETIPGDVYIAQPYDNPFGSLLALYVVMQEPQRGVQIKLAGKVETDPVSGQITASFDDLPQLPFSSFDFKFREGARAPLVTPPACGTYETHAEFTPWSNPSTTLASNSSFQITRGIGGGSCPAGGLPPFHPGLLAGSINNNAGSYSPFNLRLFRSDAEQEITNFSIKLPPGITGKLAGIPFCSDAAINAAKARSGADELTSSSCPAASEVGRTMVGAGVGSVQAYVPGKLYLAGPYNGSPLSIVSITAAKVGPFDLGTVVVREALRINPETAEVFIDPTGSDPIPHIIKGITVHLRDIRAYVDKPDFVLNPTSCAPTSTASTVLGSGLDFTSAADDQPVTVSTRFQAASCASLGFKPALALSLKGATKRGKNPALRAVLRPRSGDANAKSISVALPHSEFLAQSHIRTVCTRVQFKAGAGNGAQCPAGSVYGHARAFTPLLAEPLEGPVFLRSSEHQLPDLVLALHGLFDFNAIGRIDSVKGGIRNTFDFVPDAPIDKVVLRMQGGKKSLLENSTDLCRAKHRATAKLSAQNGKVSDFNPVLAVKCPKHAKRQKRQR